MKPRRFWAKEPMSFMSFRNMKQQPKIATRWDSQDRLKTTGDRPRTPQFYALGYIMAIWHGIVQPATEPFFLNGLFYFVSILREVSLFCFYFARDSAENVTPKQ